MRRTYNKSELIDEICEAVLQKLYDTVKANKAKGMDSIVPDEEDDTSDELDFSSSDDDDDEMMEAGSQKKSKSLVGVPSNWNKSKTIGKQPKQRTQKRVFPM